jgi:hypothetical protein
MISGASPFVVATASSASQQSSSGTGNGCSGARR